MQCNNICWNSIFITAFAAWFASDGDLLLCQRERNLPLSRLDGLNGPSTRVDRNNLRARLYAGLGSCLPRRAAPPPARFSLSARRRDGGRP
jgi:hypothetical protein